MDWMPFDLALAMHKIINANAYILNEGGKHSLELKVRKLDAFRLSSHFHWSNWIYLKFILQIQMQIDAWRLNDNHKKNLYTYVGIGSYRILSETYVYSEGVQV